MKGVKDLRYEVSFLKFRIRHEVYKATCKLL